MAVGEFYSFPVHNRSGDHKDRIQISETRSAHEARRSRIISRSSHLSFTDKRHARDICWPKLRM